MIFAFVYSCDYPIDDEMYHKNECCTIDYDYENPNRLSSQYDYTIINANGEPIEEGSETREFYAH